MRGAALQVLADLRVGGVVVGTVVMGDRLAMVDPVVIAGIGVLSGLALGGRLRILLSTPLKTWTSARSPPTCRDPGVVDVHDLHLWTLTQHARAHRARHDHRRHRAHAVLGAARGCSSLSTASTTQRRWSRPARRVRRARLRACPVAVSPPVRCRRRSRPPADRGRCGGHLLQRGAPRRAGRSGPRSEKRRVTRSRRSIEPSAWLCAPTAERRADGVEVLGEHVNSCSSRPSAAISPSAAPLAPGRDAPQERHERARRGEMTSWRARLLERSGRLERGGEASPGTNITTKSTAPPAPRSAGGWRGDGPRRPRAGVREKRHRGRRTPRPAGTSSGALRR